MIIFVSCQQKLFFGMDGQITEKGIHKIENPFQSFSAGDAGALKQSIVHLCSTYISLLFQTDSLEYSFQYAAERCMRTSSLSPPVTRSKMMSHYLVGGRGGSRYLDGGLGCVLGLGLDGLDQLRPRLEERGAAGHLLLHRGGGRGRGSLSGGEGRGEGHRLGRQRAGADQADRGALVDSGGWRLGGRRSWRCLDGRARRWGGGGGGSALRGARHGHLVLKQVREVLRLVADKLQHL